MLRRTALLRCVPGRGGGGATHQVGSYRTDLRHSGFIATPWDYHSGPNHWTGQGVASNENRWETEWHVFSMNMHKKDITAGCSPGSIMPRHGQHDSSIYEAFSRMRGSGPRWRHRLDNMGTMIMAGYFSMGWFTACIFGFLGSWLWLRYVQPDYYHPGTWPHDGMENGPHSFCYRTVPVQTPARFVALPWCAGVYQPRDKIADHDNTFGSIIQNAWSKQQLHCMHKDADQLSPAVEGGYDNYPDFQLPTSMSSSRKTIKILNRLPHKPPGSRAPGTWTNLD